jgi:hypothetical protein
LPNIENNWQSVTVKSCFLICSPLHLVTLNSKKAVSPAQ